MTPTKKGPEATYQNLTIKGNEKDCICEKPNGKHRKRCDAYRMSNFLIEASRVISAGKNFKESPVPSKVDEFEKGAWVHEPPIELQVEPGHLALIIKEAEAKLKKEFVEAITAEIAIGRLKGHSVAELKSLLKKYE